MMTAQLVTNIMAHPSTHQNFIESITSGAMRSRLDALREQRPDIEALHAIMKRGTMFYEWAHTVGVTADDQLRSIAPPIPPFRLRQIATAPPEPLFLWTGIKDAETIVGHFRRYRAAISKARVLDFGCGCGRLIRFLSQSQSLSVFGAEVNPDHATWCQSNLLAAKITNTSPLPPTSFPDNPFAKPPAVLGRLKAVERILE